MPNRQPADNELCSAMYPKPGPDFGLMCNETATTHTRHRALAEVWTSGRRFVAWTAEGATPDEIEQLR